VSAGRSNNNSEEEMLLVAGHGRMERHKKGNESSRRHIERERDTHTQRERSVGSCDEGQSIKVIVS
jgi:hypothetical protein